MTITVTREVASVEDWYQTDGIVDLYKKMKKILEQDFNFDDVQEVFYMQNMDNNKFETEIYATNEVSTRGIRKIQDIGSNTRVVYFINYFPRTPIKSTDDGYFGTMQLDITAKLEVDMPGKEDSLMDSVFRRIWFNLLYRQQFYYWVEFTREELLRFVNRVREFLDLEPTVGKTRRLHFEPLESAL
ncbi:MAG: hypothetical protein SVV03_05920 [Candidatus Nanohaloarchaea archaeon]|nr:hypothetical protein [Candidatus Nanohaloarchaea archaeon]